MHSTYFSCQDIITLLRVISPRGHHDLNLNQCNLLFSSLLRLKRSLPICHLTPRCIGSVIIPSGCESCLLPWRNLSFLLEKPLSAIPEISNWESTSSVMPEIFYQASTFLLFLFVFMFLSFQGGFIMGLRSSYFTLTLSPEG